MGLLRKKKKKEAPLSVEAINKLLIEMGHLKIVSEEDDLAKKFFKVIGDRKKGSKEVLRLWKELMKRGERVYRVADVGRDIRSFADSIGYDNEGREIKGKGIYVIMGVPAEDVYAEYGEGPEELTSEAPKYPYTGSGFTVTGDGSLIPELYLKKSYNPIMILVHKINANGKMEGEFLRIFGN